MKKFATLLLILFLATFIAGIYGMLHNQISYSVAPEYFTKFKFFQFELLDEGMSGDNFGRPRAGAALVGFLATFWMGIIIGAVLGLVGLIHKDWKTMLTVTLKAFLITIAIAFTTGLIGLAYGHFYLVQQPLSHFEHWTIPEKVTNLQRFIKAGSMHNFSYIGGVLGLLAGLGYSIYQKRKDSNGTKVDTNRQISQN